MEFFFFECEKHSFPASSTTLVFIRRLLYCSCGQLQKVGHHCRYKVPWVQRNTPPVCLKPRVRRGEAHLSNFCSSKVYVRDCAGRKRREMRANGTDVLYMCMYVCVCVWCWRVRYVRNPVFMSQWGYCQKRFVVGARQWTLIFGTLRVRARGKTHVSLKLERDRANTGHIYCTHTDEVLPVFLCSRHHIVVGSREENAGIWTGWDGMGGEEDEGQKSWGGGRKSGEMWSDVSEAS